MKKIIIIAFLAFSSLTFGQDTLEVTSGNFVIQYEDGTSVPDVTTSTTVQKAIAKIYSLPKNVDYYIFNARTKVRFNQSDSAIVEPEVCPEGFEGTPPSCTEIIIEPEVCPEGFEGTPPSCTEIIIEPEPLVCEEGYQLNGTGDACVLIPVVVEPETCPEGFEGTPPNCTAIVVEPEPISCTAPLVNVNDVCQTTNASCVEAGFDMANSDNTGCMNHEMPPMSDMGNMPSVNLDLRPAPAIGSSTMDIKATSDFGATGVGGAQFRINCRFSHMSNDDPLIFPNQQGLAHDHTFVGNTSVNYASDVENLHLVGDSTCSGGVANRSAYWTPTLIDTSENRPLVPFSIVFYYKTNNPAAVTVPPTGLRFITGRPESNPDNPQGAGWSREVIRWTCNDVYTGKQNHIPACTGKLTLMIISPTCWDGVNKYKSDQSHMAYTNNGQCPSTHQTVIPEVALNLHYQVNGTSNLRLSSDNYIGSAGGYSAHSDWVNGWNPAVLTQIVNGCLKAGKDCHADLLGNGQTLFNKFAPWDVNTVPVPLK